ncbi:hypothetical protein [Methylobacterium durans]|uniref:hypothetical protein n=1 Tax=Methylobacterium durans TaxID=2202825 RepID=UPI0013A58DD8|nr:hypothetical protein [Methylobacterium durans]
MVAKVEGLEENFVSVYARAAREAGLISHHGRGRNAARMTPIDAANLLIAVNASSLAKNVPKTIQKYSELRRARDGGHYLGACDVADRISAKGVSFAEALAQLMETEDERSNVEVLLEAAKDPSFSKLQPHMRSGLKVEFEGPYPAGRIVIKALSEVGVAQTPRLINKADFLYIRQAERPLGEIFGDRVQTTSISGLTLRAVAQVLRT